MTSRRSFARFVVVVAAGQIASIGCLFGTILVAGLLDERPFFLGVLLGAAIDLAYRTVRAFEPEQDWGLVAQAQAERVKRRETANR